jgi:biotin operon repressor
MPPPPLTPEQEQERLELIQRQNAAAKELASTYEKMAKTIKGISDEEKETLDIAKKISKASSDLEKAISKRLDKTSSVKDLQKVIQTLEQNSLKNANLAKALDQKRLEAQKKFQQLDNDRVRLAKSLYDSQNLADEEAKKLVEKETELSILSNSRLKVDRDRAKVLAKEVAELRTESKVTLYNLNQKQKQVDLAEKAVDEQYDIVKQIQAAAKANEKVNEELAKEIELLKQEEQQKKKIGFYNVIQEKFNTKFVDDWYKIIKSGNTFLAWIAFFKLALESALRFNAISVDISKNLGYSTAEADRLTQNLVDVAAHSGNINVTLKNAGEAMSELNNATGLVGEYSADTLETQIMLTKQFGLQADEAAGIYKLSVLNNESASATNKAMVGAFVAARNSLKVGANFRQVMAEAAKVSGQLAANLGYSPERITKAVVAMKAFGTTLEQTKAQGEALLNFESSLEAELKAELLTGQQLNLERARAAALAGDQVALAQELANQGMTLEKFSKMNVIAQRSYAEAIGLSADQLSEQLQKQKLAKEQGKSLAQITEEEALEAEKRQKIQDKFNQAIEKLQDLIGNLVAGPLSIFLDGLTSALTLVGYILRPIQFIADLAGAIGEKFASWADALGPFGILLKGIAGIAIVLAAYGAYAALAWIPVVGPILGAAAAVAVLAKGFSSLAGAEQAGDMYSPADGKTQVSTKEGGLFELSKNDDLIAGPGLADKVKGGKDGAIVAPQIDLTPMIAAINAVKESVDKLYNKDTSISMDGKKVGTTLTQGSYKVA